MLDRILKAISTWPYARIAIGILLVTNWFTWSKLNQKDLALTQCKVGIDSLRVYYTNILTQVREQNAADNQARLEKDKAELQAKIDEMDKVLNQSREKLRNK